MFHGQRDRKKTNNQTSTTNRQTNKQKRRQYQYAVPWQDNPVRIFAYDTSNYCQLNSNNRSEHHTAHRRPAQSHCGSERSEFHCRINRGLMANKIPWQWECHHRVRLRCLVWQTIQLDEHVHKHTNNTNRKTDRHDKVTKTKQKDDRATTPIEHYIHNNTATKKHTTHTQKIQKKAKQEREKEKKAKPNATHAMYSNWANRSQHQNRFPFESNRISHRPHEMWNCKNSIATGSTAEIAVMHLLFE